MARFCCRLKFLVLFLALLEYLEGYAPVSGTVLAESDMMGTEKKKKKKMAINSVNMDFMSQNEITWNVNHTSCII